MVKANFATNPASTQKANRDTEQRIDPIEEHAYWRAEYPRRAYYQNGVEYSDIAPAYEYGWSAKESGQYNNYEDAQADAEERWKIEHEHDIHWNHVKEAFRDAWYRAGYRRRSK